MRTDCPCPGPLARPGCLGAAPFGLERDGGGGAQRLEEQRLWGLQFRFRSKLLRSQLRESEHAKESKPQHNYAGGQQALLLPPPASTRWHTPLSCRQEPEGSGGWRELGAARPLPAFPANSGLCFSQQDPVAAVFTAHGRTAVPREAERTPDPKRVSQGDPPSRAPLFVHIIIQQSIQSTCYTPSTSLIGAMMHPSSRNHPHGHSWRFSMPRANAREKGPRPAQLRWKERAQGSCPG